MLADVNFTLIKKLVILLEVKLKVTRGKCYSFNKELIVLRRIKTFTAEGKSVSATSVEVNP